MDADEVLAIEPYEEVAQQGQAAPPSPAYAPNPIEVEDYVPVYVLEPKEDPVDYAADADDDEDEEESSKDDDDEEEEHLAPANSTTVAFPTVDLVPFAEETGPFKTDKSAATPPPPPIYRTTSRMSVRSQAPILFPSEAEVARILALPTPPPSPLTPLSLPLPQIPSPPLPLPSPPTHTSPTYAEAPLGYRAAEIRLRAASPLLSPTSPPTHHPLQLPAPYTSRKANIPEADIPPRKRLLLTPPHLGLRLGRVLLLLLLDSQDLLWPVGSITSLWILWMPVRRRESEESYTRHQDAQRDRVSLRGEVDTLRRYLSSLCTTHKQERVEARQALARSKAHNRALEARIAVLETQAHCHEWQCQDADDRAIGHIMRIQELEAGARVDTLEDTGSSA
ncbi:hypothetical protein Tco_0120667 [Tanacetum coccineum]